MNKVWKFALGLTLSVILLCVGFVAGFAVSKWIPGSGLALASDSGNPVGSHVDEVNALLQREALTPPSETSATAGSIQGLLESGGDKYGLYFDERHFEYFNQSNSGEFGGIGVTLGEKDGSAYVVEVFEGNPAQKAGVKTGDEFVTIDGVTREKWTTDEVVKRVRGKEGTGVKITFRRPGARPTDEPANKTFTITRDIIEFPNVESERYGDVGYVRIAQFNAKASEDIAVEIKKLEKAGARSFVLDVRDNPGGLLSEAVDVSSLFIDKGVIVRVDERNKPEVEHRATGNALTDAPLVVLINGNSASASEIVGGALQDYRRAKLVGEKSFGKGSVQTVETLSFGGAVKYTIAHYLTPKSRVIDGKGLTPDVVVKMEPEKQADPKTDTQLQRALKLARDATP